MRLSRNDLLLITIPILLTLLIFILQSNKIAFATEYEDETMTEQSGNSAFSPELIISSNDTPQETGNEALTALSAPKSIPSNPGLKKVVFTHLPYWQVNDEADAYLQYKYMTHLVFHGISLGKNGVINKTNGTWIVWKGEKMKKIVTNARSSGAKVMADIVLFNSANSSGLTDFLNNETARNKGVNQIINLLKTSPQPLDGLVIDMEYPKSSNSDEFVSFIKKLRKEMKDYNSKLELYIDVNGSSYRGGGYNLPALSPEVDGFFVMSYHLKDPGTAKKAGSTNPISSLQTLSENFLKKIPGEKIILGFPLYLAEWKTLDDSLHATKKPDTGGGKTTIESDCGVSGSTCTRLAQRFAKTYGKKYDKKDKAAYYSFYVCSGKKGWRQVYFDDEQAFTDKFAIVNSKNLKGVGFWAQNYDKGYLDTWNAIYNQFADKDKLSKPSKKAGFVNPSPIPSNGCISPSGSPTPLPDSDTKITIDVGLNGIGSTGNKNPKKKSAKINIDIFAPDGIRIGNLSKEIPYNKELGRYKGQIPIPISQKQVYNFYISSPSYLTSRIDKEIIPETGNDIKTFNLSAGDINGDSVRNLLDWNLINACSIYDRAKDNKVCQNGSLYMINSDLNSDGKVDLDDINLWRREFNFITP